jgi:4-hydroxy-tetrahydrodipicolinate synthase
VTDTTFAVGIQSIVVTPFKDDGQVDLSSLQSLVDGVIQAGVHGITALGVAAESHKLSTNERSEIAKHIFDVADNRCDVIVGVSTDELTEVVANAQWAEQFGAAGVMIAPPHGREYGPALIEHYMQVASIVDLPIVLQDYKAFTGVDLSPGEMAELVEAVPAIRAIKLETPPTALRIAETRRLIPETIVIVGGIGGVYFLDELRNGSAGTMTGFAYPEVLLEIYERFLIGDQVGAEAAYHKYLPLLEFEGQPNIGLAIRKEILRQRGLIVCGKVRDQPPLSNEILSRLADVLHDTGVRELFDQ